MSRHSTDLGLSEHDKSVLQKREEHGWFVNMIAKDSDRPGFAYSFGLFEEFQHPEIIIFGLDSAIMHRIINNAGNQIQKGIRYSDGDVTKELLEGYDCAFRRVNPLQYRGTCAWAVWFYGNADFPVLQLFWPDKGHRFPWDDKFTESLRQLQPDLREPPLPCKQAIWTIP
jgi:Domain of unknown function (DUF4262)